MATKKYVSLSKLSVFLGNLKNTFAALSHKHTMSDISDYAVDNALSPTSTNPVQNKVIDAEFEAISEAMAVFEAAIDDKLDTADYVVDSELSNDSTNPIQNTAVTAGLDAKMNITNPTGTGSFSLNRKSSTTVGDYSVAMGRNAEASGQYSYAEGRDTTASGLLSHAEGSGTTASGSYSHAEGGDTTASGRLSHAEGSGTTASGQCSHAEGVGTTTSGANSHAEGRHTTASSDDQHVQGKFNIEDADNIYAHIVGNGSSKTARSNAHTLDWDGNAWYAGTVKVGGTSYNDASEVALKSDIENHTHTMVVVSDTAPTTPGILWFDTVS